jgi:hypothetical protein
MVFQLPALEITLCGQDILLIGAICFLVPVRGATFSPFAALGAILSALPMAFDRTAWPRPRSG